MTAGARPTAEAPTSPRVIVFNGGSSSGKSTLTRAVQDVLPGTWLRLGVDTLVEACPPSLLSGEGLELGADGNVGVGGAFTAVERFWMAGVALMAKLGAWCWSRTTSSVGRWRSSAGELRWRSSRPVGSGCGAVRSGHGRPARA